MYIKMSYLIYIVLTVSVNFLVICLVRLLNMIIVLHSAIYYTFIIIMEKCY